MQTWMGTSQWAISGGLLALIMVLGLVDREQPWCYFKARTLAFTALPILMGYGVKESGLGEYILSAIKCLGGSSDTTRWLVTMASAFLLTQVVHNSIVVSVLVPSLLTDRVSFLVGTMALSSLSLCFPIGYPLNSLVLEKTRLANKSIILPGLGVGLVTLLGVFVVVLVK